VNHDVYRVIETTNNDTSLAMISASTRAAVLICAAPALSANKPDRIFFSD
jgi:hypothetical protein